MLIMKTIYEDTSESCDTTTGAEGGRVETLTDSKADTRDGAAASSFSDVQKVVLVVPVVAVFTFIHALRSSTLHYMYREFVCSGDLSAKAFPYECAYVDVHHTRLNVASSLLEGLASLLSAGLWGHMGDVYGRAVPFLVSAMGGIILDMYFFFLPRTTFFQQNAVFWAISAHVVSACLGGNAAAVGAAHAYIADYTSLRSRFFAFALLVGLSVLMANVGGFLGIRMTGVWSLDPRLSGLGFLLTSAGSAFIALYVYVVLPRPTQTPSVRSSKPFSSAISAVISNRRFALLSGAVFASGLSWPVHKLWTIILYPLNHHKQYLRGVAIADWIVLYKAESFIAVLLVIPAAAWFSTRRAPSNGRHQIFDVVWSAATLYLLADLIPAGGVCVLALWRPKVALILTVLSPLRIGSKPALFAMASMTDSDSRRRQIAAPAPTTTTTSNDSVHNDATRYVGIKMGILSALFHFGVSLANLVHPLLIARDSPGLPRHLNVLALTITLLNVALTLLGALRASDVRHGVVVVSSSRPQPQPQKKDELQSMNLNAFLV